jgi:hypothetical protein
LLHWCGEARLGTTRSNTEPAKRKTVPRQRHQAPQCGQGEKSEDQVGFGGGTLQQALGLGLKSPGRQCGARRSGGDQVVAHSLHHSLDCRVHAKLLASVLDMRVHGCSADAENFTDLELGLSLAGPFEALPFSR